MYVCIRVGMYALVCKNTSFSYCFCALVGVSANLAIVSNIAKVAKLQRRSGKN